MARHFAPLNNDNPYELDTLHFRRHKEAGDHLTSSSKKKQSPFMPTQFHNALNAYATGQAGDSDSDSDEQDVSEVGEGAKLLDGKSRGDDLEAQPAWTSNKGSGINVKTVRRGRKHALGNYPYG